MPLAVCPLEVAVREVRWIKNGKLVQIAVRIRWPLDNPLCGILFVVGRAGPCPGNDLIFASRDVVKREVEGVATDRDRRVDMVASIYRHVLVILVDPVLIP